MKSIEKIKADIDKLQETTMDENKNFLSSYHEGIFDGLSMIENFIDTIEEEPVSEDLEIAAHSYVDTTIEWFDSEGNPCRYPAFIAGAQWQKKQMIDKAFKYINYQLNLPSDFEQHFRKAMKE